MLSNSPRTNSINKLLETVVFHFDFEKDIKNRNKSNSNEKWIDEKINCFLNKLITEALNSATEMANIDIFFIIIFMQTRSKRTQTLYELINREEQKKLKNLEKCKETDSHIHDRTFCIHYIQKRPELNWTEQ